MLIEIYTVHDSATGAFLQPFFAQRDGAALRGFSDLVNQEGHEFNKHPEGYTLFNIGTYNDENGTIEPREPKSLGNAVTFLTGER